MKVPYIIILVFIICILIQETNVNAYSHLTNKMSVVCNDFKEDIVITKTPHQCTFYYFGIFPENLFKDYSLKVYDSVTNISFLNENLIDMVISKEPKENYRIYTYNKDYFEYNISYPIQIYFDEEGIHRISFDLKLFEEQNTFEVFNVESMSYTSFKQYNLSKRRISRLEDEINIFKDLLDMQNKSNERQFYLQNKSIEGQIETNKSTFIISLAMMVIAVISTLISLFHGNKRVVEISKIKNNVELDVKDKYK